MHQGNIRPFDRQPQSSNAPLVPTNNFFKPKLTVLSVDEILARVAPEWLVNGVLPEFSLAVLYGPSGTFKTFVAADLAFHIACDKSWHGRDVKAGNVLYVLGEGGASFSRRIRAWLLRKGVKSQNLKAGFLSVPVQLSNQDDVSNLFDAIYQWIVKSGVPTLRLIVIDTLASCFGSGDENSQKDMTAFLNGARQLQQKFGATVLLVHHTGKDPHKRERGSSVLRGAADTMIRLVRGETPLTATLHIDKQKEADESKALKIQLDRVPDPDGAENLSLVLQSVSIANGNDNTQLDGLALKVLRQSPNLRAAEWRIETIEANGSAEGLAETTFDRLWSRLMVAGRVERDKKTKRFPRD